MHGVQKSLQQKYTALQVAVYIVYMYDTPTETPVTDAGWGWGKELCWEDGGGEASWVAAIARSLLHIVCYYRGKR